VNCSVTEYLVWGESPITTMCVVPDGTTKVTPPNAVAMSRLKNATVWAPYTLAPR
jgi:hypothetical protein